MLAVDERRWFERVKILRADPPGCEPCSGEQDWSGGRFP